MRRQYFEVCKNCGAHLDPRERCDCEEARAGVATAAAPIYNLHQIRQSGALHMQTAGGGMAPYTAADGRNRHGA